MQHKASSDDTSDLKQKCQRETEKPRTTFFLNLFLHRIQNLNWTITFYESFIISLICRGYSGYVHGIERNTVAEGLISNGDFSFT